MNFKQLVTFFSVFSPNAEYDQKKQSAFECFDVDEDGKIGSNLSLEKQFEGIFFCDSLNSKF